MTIKLRLYQPRKNITLQLDIQLAGQGVTAIYGPSGCGKTSLLRVIAGLDVIEGAVVSVNGDAWQQADGYFKPVHQRRVGYVFQDAALFSHLNVQQNLEYGWQRIPAAQRVVNPEQIIALLDLQPLLQASVQQLSGGERQRLAIGRSLLACPQLLLMDEPLASLDETRKQKILPYLQQACRTLNIPVVYVTHSLDEVACLADDLLLMREGKIIAQGSVSQLLLEPQSDLLWREQAFALVTAQVDVPRTADGLTACQLDGQQLWLPAIECRPGDKVRLACYARDVSISLQPIENTSVLNSLVVSIQHIYFDGQKGQVLLVLALAQQQLLARVSLRSLHQLALHDGKMVYAAVKAVALARNS